MSAETLSEDLCEYLDVLGLGKAKTALKKSLIGAFVDGVIVAEIIAANYPRMVELQNYTPTSSAVKRAENWSLLNKKLLAPLQCELGEEDIAQIVSRNIQKESVTSFLRLLQSKLILYKPTYTAEMQQAAAEQRAKAAVATPQQKTSTPSAAKDRRKSAGDALSATSASKTIPSASAATATSAGISATKRPSMIKNQQILSIIKSKEDVRRRASLMKESDIETLFNEVAVKYRIDTEARAKQVDQMQKRSAEIDSHISALRAQNLVICLLCMLSLSVLSPFTSHFLPPLQIQLLRRTI